MDTIILFKVKATKQLSTHSHGMSRSITKNKIKMNEKGFVKRKTYKRKFGGFSRAAFIYIIIHT